jgi:twinkle protein
MATYEELDIQLNANRQGNQKTFCPNCRHQRKNKTDKSLSVQTSTGRYNCHYCGFHGIVDGKTKEEGRQEWKERQKQYARPEPLALPIRQNIIDWFKKRGITPDTLQYFKVSESSDWMPAKGDTPAGVRKTINFNYYRGDQKINVKYRDHLKTFRLVKDAELILYNLNALNDRTDMLICEGEIDCMSFYQSGHYGAVSVPNGASKGSAKLEYLDQCADVLQRMVKVIIATDDDTAGHFLRDELARRIGREKCWFVNYPAGCKDANEVQLKYGLEAVRALWTQAIPPPLEHILTADDMAGDLDQIYRDGWPEPMKAGYSEFDRLIGFLPGQLTTVTGSPGHGKGEFLEQLMIRLATRCGWKIGYFSYEEPPLIKTVRLCQKYVGLPFVAKPGYQTERMNLAQQQTARHFVADHFFYIDTDKADITIDGILAKARELVLRKGINVFIIDPYTCIESRRPHTQSETEYIGEVMQKLTQFAKLNNVHVFLVAHPTKMKKEKGKYLVPTLYDIAGSANFYNKTHNGLCVYRDFSTNLVIVYVQKIKFDFCGRLGSQAFTFDVLTGRYTEEGMAYESEIEQQRRRQVQMGIAYESPDDSSGSPAEVDTITVDAPVRQSSDLTHWAAPLPEDHVPF